MSVRERTNRCFSNQRHSGITAGTLDCRSLTPQSESGLTGWVQRFHPWVLELSNPRMAVLAVAEAKETFIQADRGELSSGLTDRWVFDSDADE